MWDNRSYITATFTFETSCDGELYSEDLVASALADVSEGHLTDLGRLRVCTADGDDCELTNAIADAAERALAYRWCEAS